MFPIELNTILTTVLAYDRGQLTYLTPGSYVAPNPLSNDDLSMLYPKSNATYANITSLHIGSSLVVVPPPRALLFSRSNYKGDVAEDLVAWRSAYFSQDFYGLLGPGKAIWGAVPDVTQLRGASTSLRKVGLGQFHVPYPAEAPRLTRSDLRSSLCIRRDVPAGQWQSRLRMRRRLDGAELCCLRQGLLREGLCP